MSREKAKRETARYGSSAAYLATVSRYNLNDDEDDIPFWAKALGGLLLGLACGAVKRWVTGQW